MTVRHIAGTIALEGVCGVDEAETVLRAILEAPEAAIDWSACSRLHTAVVQIIVATNVPVRGICGDPWLRRWAPEIIRR
jgi:hypothetical protein